MGVIITFAIVGLGFLLACVYFYMQNMKNIKLIKELRDELNKNYELLNNKDIDLATCKTALSEQKIRYDDLQLFNVKRVDELKQELSKLTLEKNELQNKTTKEQSLISELQTKLNEQQNAMQEKIKFLNDSEVQLKEQFKNLATEIFDSNSKKFSEQNSQSLGLILNPMKQQLTDFKKKVEDVYDKESKDRSALQNELKTLKELNQKMSEEAQNLTKALKGDSKTQGNWGEMVLEKVLESSGLREGYEFKREVNLKDDENKTFRPDVIVYLPNQRQIIIDAKTSLSAYNEYISHEGKDKQMWLKNHIKSVKGHIKELSNKKYEDLKNINSLDFIFMFVPIEGALLLALEHDVNLYDEAFKQKIILVSPTTLLVALRAVENTWRYERQAQNIAEVYKRAEELYKKFTGFVEDLKKVGKGLDAANESYNDAFKKLSEGSGNLVRQVTMLKKVSNIKPKKELDNALVDTAMIDTQPCK